MISSACHFSSQTPFHRHDRNHFGGNSVLFPRHGPESFRTASALEIVISFSIPQKAAGAKGFLFLPLSLTPVFPPDAPRNQPGGEILPAKECSSIFLPPQNIRTSGQRRTPKNCSFLLRETASLFLLSPRRSLFLKTLRLFHNFDRILLYHRRRKKTP